MATDSATLFAMLVPLLAVAMLQPKITLCEVLKKPAAFRQQLISLQATLVSAWPHGAFLQDDACPRHILRLGRDRLDADDSAKKLDFCSDSRTSEGTFTGSIAYSDKGIIEFRLRSTAYTDPNLCKADQPPPAIPANAPTMQEAPLPLPNRL